MGKEISDTFSLSPAIPFSLRDFEDFQKRFVPAGVTLDPKKSYFSVEGFQPMHVNEFEVKGNLRKKIYMYHLEGTAIKGGEVFITLQRLTENTVHLDSKYIYNNFCEEEVAKALLERVQNVVRILYSKKGFGQKSVSWPQQPI